MTHPPLAARQALALLRSAKVVEVTYEGGRVRAVVEHSRGRCNTDRHRSTLARRLAPLGVPKLGRMTPGARDQMRRIAREIDERLAEIPEWSATAEEKARARAEGALTESLEFAVRLSAGLGLAPDDVAARLRSMAGLALAAEVMES